MTSIDLATGLPAVPEGQFWRVKEHEVGWWDSGVTPYVEIQLVERVEVDHREPRMFLGIQFGYRGWGVVVKEQIIARQSLWSDLKVPENYTGLAVRHEGERYFPVYKESVRPHEILRAAEEALSGYKAKEESEKLLGDYPPKTLEVVE